MGDKSKIEWTDASWNPIRGCSLVSAGCTNCYAMRVAHRLKSYRGLTRMTEHGPVWTGQVRLVPELLDQPLRWKRPRRIFVNSMSDLFHESVPDDFVFKVFETMISERRHTFQILTKRPERMKKFLFLRDWSEDHAKLAPHICLGVSCEDQKTADDRIPLLLQTPAAVRWISAEPLLGAMDLRSYLPWPQVPQGNQNFLNWVVVGGESGPHARPMHPDWARKVRDDCVNAGVPFFFKQWGEWVSIEDSGEEYWEICKNPARVHSWPDGPCSYRVGKKAAGRLLDGREWNEYPEVK